MTIHKSLSLMILLAIFTSARLWAGISQVKQTSLKDRITSFVKEHPVITGTGVAGTVVVLVGGGIGLFKMLSSRAQKAVIKILYGHADLEKSGTSRENEDQLSIKTAKVNNLLITTFCVCDGTGGPGVSKYIAGNIHDKLKYAFRSNNDSDIAQNIKDACVKLDFEIRDKLLKGTISDGQNQAVDNSVFTPAIPPTQGDIVSGSTATIGIVVQKPDGTVDFWSCNVGDSKTMVTQNNNGQEHIIFESEEHLLTSPHESDRMENFVNPYDSSINYVYNAQANRRSNLTTSRLFGSWRHKADQDDNYEQSAVIAIPDVQKVELNPKQATVIVTSDGLLHTLHEQDMVGFIDAHIDKEALSKEASKSPAIKESDELNRCAHQLINQVHVTESHNSDNGGGYRDDKGVIIAKLI